MIKLITILIITSLSIVFLYRHLLDVEFEYTNQLISTPDQKYYSHQFKYFSLVNTNNKGSISSIVKSPSTRIITGQQITVFDDPELIMKSNHEAPIVITAKQAEMFHKQNKTSFYNDVKVVMENTHGNEFVMTTEQLDINNQTQHAYTSLPATITHEKGSMQGIGVEFNPHDNHIKLLSEVRGLYEL